MCVYTIFKLKYVVTCMYTQLFKSRVQAYADDMCVYKCQFTSGYKKSMTIIWAGLVPLLLSL